MDCPAKIILAMLFAMILFGCANQLPPGGGEVDTIPPEIIETYPKDGTVNYKENYFEFTFSEYVDKRSFREAIFISPAVDGEMEVDWTGKTVTVSFPKGFKPNLTYVVNIGTDVVDLNNRNRMASSFNLTFSTGYEIDRRKISGKVFNKDAEGTLIFGYIMNDDTTNYLLSKPMYISQIGKDGKFQLNGLAAAKYRVFAVKDQIKDFIFQADQDMIGIPFQDLTLAKSDSSFDGLNFFLVKADTTKPRLMEALMTDERHILTKFSEEPDTSSIRADNFRIVDSTFSLVSNILYAYKSSNKKEEIVLVPEEKLNIESQLFLMAENFSDISGNRNDSDKVALTISDRADTTSIKIVKTDPLPNSKIDFINSRIFIYFDDAFVKEKINGAIDLSDSSGNKIPISISFTDDATLLLMPLIKLKPDNNYILKIDLNFFEDANGNKTDSVYQLKFSTLTGLEFTGLSGKIENGDSTLILVLESVSNPDKKYYHKIKSNPSFSFERIEAGNYKLWAFEDKNQDGIYDFGWFAPFRFSEKFYVYPEELTLKPRWTLTDLIFKIKYEGQYRE
ncbi:MAG: Ig-like domain-containing protein [Ignavibacterium album]|uniref:Ig-like domain-containing protein n=1 Tax=Ignavibacterium album TaxID=591197 RepID=UPI0026E91C97|nr:Ig-like domain-containing protein [Ignavibacterium album]MCX8106561.1 Ig-like domain-containing protein [Ignavibacterium album]